MATEEQIERLRALSIEIDELYDVGEEKGGVELLERALKEAEAVDPAYALFFQGEQAGYAQKDHARQEELFRQALVHRPSDCFLLRNLGAALSLQGKEEEALACDEKALELNPQDFLSWGSKGVSLSKQGKEDEALACYEKALELNPQDYDSWRNKGVSLSKQGKEDEALACYEKALELNPQDYNSWRQKGVTLSKQGKREESLACAEKALALWPGNADALVDKAYELYLLGRKQEALKLIATVTKEHPDNKYAHEVQGYLLFLENKGPVPAARKGKPEMQRLALVSLVEAVRKRFKPEVDGLLRSMKASTKHINDFLKPESLLRKDKALFFILRKWNSYTPCIPRDGEERSIGGGYYFLVKGVGTVIDPGYNFLENFHRIGGRITDIHNIVITHAHNDHTADLESILSLVYKFNDDENKKIREVAGVGPKSVRLFLNAGCQRKFSGLLDLRGADYLDDVQTLMPGHSYDMGQGLTLRALPAYHDEVVAKKYAVGLQFDLANDGSEPTRVVITSDTGLFPQTKDKKADMGRDEIWELYKIPQRSIHLLIPHIGSVKESELKPAKSRKKDKESQGDPLDGVFYPNHLGVLGTVRVISALEPVLAVVSEFGEELQEYQDGLVKWIAECVQSFQPVEGAPALVLPGDITFIYELSKREVYCIASGKTVPPSSDMESYIYKVDKQDLFYYYNKKMKKSLSYLNKRAKVFENKLAKRELYNLIHKAPGKPKAP